ncbi:hypothetical protein [Ruicaihuangia caeni]|uniref:hypothetical protein n=1 Tax=Ruicaihuangia caeni TaxID=3042517 RepID=UPI00338EB90C
METTGRDRRPTAVAAGVALALAACAGLSLAVGDAIGFVSPSAEAGFTLLFVAGWVLLIAAIVVGVAVLVRVIRAVAFGRRPPLLETAFVVATVAIIAAVVVTHPLIGSGSGAG